MGYTIGHRNILQQGSDGGKACPDPTSDELYQRKLCSCGSGFPITTPPSTITTPPGNSDLPPSLSSNKNIFIRTRQNNEIYTISIRTYFGIIQRSNLTAPNNDDNFSENTNKIVRVMDPNNFIINYNKSFRSINFQYKYDPETDLLLEIETGLKFFSF
jgi:hypothetical protein